MMRSPDIPYSSLFLYSTLNLYLNPFTLKLIHSPKINIKILWMQLKEVELL